MGEQRPQVFAELRPSREGCCVSARVEGAPDRPPPTFVAVFGSPDEAISEVTGWALGWLRSAAVFCMVLAATTALGTAQAVAGKPCNHVVSYFLYPYQGSQLKQYEWRIFDPSRRTDVLFLSLRSGIEAGGFGGVCWDTTFDNVCFGAGDSLYRVQWRLGAKPRLITKLPAGHGRWWFNPDSGCWQALRVLGQPKTDDPDYNRYGGELWQSTRDGASWRRIRADSLDLVDSDNHRWQWSDGSAPGREAPVMTLDDLASEAWEESWGGKTALIDTSTVTLMKDDGTGYSSEQWFFLGLEVSPRRGIAFQLSGPLAPEHGWMGVTGPFYFVDLDRRTKRLLAGTEVGIMRSLVAEHCGHLLVPGVMGNPLVIDSSGRKVFSKPWNSEDAVWVPRPRP